MSCVMIVLSLLGYFNNVLALIAVNTYVFFFEIGLGPIPWLIVGMSLPVTYCFCFKPYLSLLAAEMFEGKFVATAMSLCCQLNWACNFIIGLVFPTMNHYLGAYSFGPFAAVLALTFVYALFVLPETQGTRPEDLVAEMVSRNSSSIVHEATNKADPTAASREWRKGMDQIVQTEQKQMKDGTFGNSLEF